MADRILTTHVGSLPRPQELIELNHRRIVGEDVDEAAFDELLASAVEDVVRRQREVGVDLVNDGELGHTMGFEYDYGAWRSYIVRRLGGVDIVELEAWGRPVSSTRWPTAPGISCSGRCASAATGTASTRPTPTPTRGARSPSSSSATSARSSAGRSPTPARTRWRATSRTSSARWTPRGSEGEGWMNAVAPASCARIANEHYASDEELLYAVADAMREEYAAIVDAGLILQLDDPAIAESWDQSAAEPSVESYKRYTVIRIDALNHAIRGLPPERIRFHLCWGSWHGPHFTDLPMADLLDVMLAVNAGAYSFEAANARHEHEWRLWEDVKLPEGKVLMPGVVSHATNVIEHPEVVADRIARYAQAVGREHVVASTDCGLGGRVHPQIAWAKLEALAQGAELASTRLWR